uniref:Glycosyltransferase N-terminal domain-containing protein n=1 Tax=Oryza barthii TaxID=65489 RepID=A0A0D3FMQ3_9ORYZ
MAHVLVVPYPSQGHMNPMVQFARKLASKGVAVTVVTTRFIERTTSSSAGGRGLDACPGVRVEAISDGHDEGGVASAASLEDAVYHYVHEGKLAVPAPEQEPATSRSAAFAGLPEMERRELPSFVLGDGPYPTLAVFALSQFADSGKDDWVLFNSFDELESEVLAGLSTQWKARAIGPCVPLPAGDGATGRFTYGANLFDPEDTCMQWLDTKPPSSVAYVSFGSFASLGAAQTEELARGLLAAGRPFLWVVRATEEAQLPRHLLDAATASGDALVSMRFMDTPSVFTPGHPATSSCVTLEPFGLAFTSPPVANLDEKRNSSPAAGVGLHGYPFTVTSLSRSATQKSWRGSGSLARSTGACCRSSTTSTTPARTLSNPKRMFAKDV